MRVHRPTRSTQSWAPQTTGRRSGFSLIEIVIVLTIMSVLAGVAIPVTKTVLDRSHAKATRVEIQALSDATAAMFEDTWALPHQVADLLVDTGIAGWSGPYLPGSFNDSISGLRGYEVDGWSRSYVLDPVGDVLRITSQGPDREIGGATTLSCRSTSPCCGALRLLSA